jgi:hypothetical protein
MQELRYLKHQKAYIYHRASIKIKTTTRGLNIRLKLTKINRQHNGYKRTGLR